MNWIENVSIREYRSHNKDHYYRNYKICAGKNTSDTQVKYFLILTQHYNHAASIVVSRNKPCSFLVCYN